MSTAVAEENWVETFESQQSKNARAFLSHLETADPSNKEVFKTIICACNTYGVSRQDLLEEFAVSAGTLSRWSKGTSLPAKYARSVILERIKSLVSARIGTLNTA